MKFRLFLLSILAVGGSVTAQAKVRTVSNYAPNSAQYSDVQTAISASNPGDTVYLHGSPINYGNFTIDRKLCVIGAGYNLANNRYNYNTEVGLIKFDSIKVLPTLPKAIRGSMLVGLQFGAVTVGSYNYIRDLTIDRCKGSVTMSGMSWVIKNSWVYVSMYVQVSMSANTSLYLYRLTRNCTISNCFVNGLSNGSSTTGAYGYSPGLVVNHCIFPNGVPYTTGATLLNNIFLESVYLTTSSTSYAGNAYNNNMTYKANSTLPLLPGTYNTGSNNKNNAYPAFTSVTTYSFGSSPILAFNSFDFTLDPSSLGYNAGTDGTSLGITSGPYPMNGEDLGGRPRLPLMTELSIFNPVINQGQPLNVRIKAKKVK
jgi:hypothetical protein